MTAENGANLFAFYLQERRARAQAQEASTASGGVPESTSTEGFTFEMIAQTVDALRPRLAGEGRASEIVTRLDEILAGSLLDFIIYELGRLVDTNDEFKTAVLSAITSERMNE